MFRGQNERLFLKKCSMGNCSAKGSLHEVDDLEKLPGFTRNSTRAAGGRSEGVGGVGSASRARHRERHECLDEHRPGRHHHRLLNLMIKGVLNYGSRILINPCQISKRARIPFLVTSAI